MKREFKVGDRGKILKDEGDKYLIKTKSGSLKRVLKRELGEK